jgi:hypothetical protein
MWYAALKSTGYVIPYDPVLGWQIAAAAAILRSLRHDLFVKMQCNTAKSGTLIIHF